MREMEPLTSHSSITFFAGENGTGKSTLMEAIAVVWGFNPEGGYFLRAESFYNVATKEIEYADVLHPLMQFHERSHGESFLELIQNKFAGPGLYILDEPEAALSPQRQLTLLLEMKKAVASGVQFIIASYSPIEMFINHRNYFLERLINDEE